MSSRKPSPPHGQRVVFLQRVMPHYRVPFFNLLRELLAPDIKIEVLHGFPDELEATKRDTVDLSWGERLPNRVFVAGDTGLVWQPAFRRTRGANLIVVEQASRLLVNYLLLARQRLGGAPVGLWGHGATFEVDPSSFGEFLKRRYSRWPRWWFAYTRRSAEVIEQLGYPSERITIVQNATDTTALRAERKALSDADLDGYRRAWGVAKGKVGLFIGGLYPAKRLPFLIEAADLIRAQIPDFQLLVVGDGPDSQAVARAASRRAWLRHVGARFRQEKAAAFAMADVLLIPGLVGLAIVDAFAMQVPLVTIDLTNHSPEIDYLESGANGLMLSAGIDPGRYADAVVSLLTDLSALERLKRGCEGAASRYTVEVMAQRFALGIRQSIALSDRSHRD